SFSLIAAEAPSTAPSTAPTPGTSEATTSGEKASKSAELPAAKIGSEDLTVSEVMSDIAKVFGPQAEAEKTKNPKQFEQIFSLFRDQNVGMRLMSQLADSESRKLEAQQEVKEMLKKARSQILIEAFMKNHLDKNLTEEKVKALYEKLSKEKPLMNLYLKHIVLSTEADAKGVIKLLKEGKPFGEVLKRSLDKESIKNGGALPPFLESQLPPAIAKEIAELKVGGFSAKPLSIGGKWEVFLLEKKDKASLEEASPILKEKLKAQLFQEIILSEKNKKNVSLFDSNGQPTQEVSPVFMTTPPAENAQTPAAG
ncbi:MAG: peptidylprolyl isomerase, partial [Holosporales bacterium]